MPDHPREANGVAAYPDRARRRYEIGLLIAGIVAASAGLLAVTVQTAWARISDDPGGFAALVALTVALALVTVELPGGAKIGVAGIGLLAVGFEYGVGAAGWTMLDRLGPAIAAGTVFWAVNIGLLTIAMASTEETSAVQLWRER